MFRGKIFKTFVTALLTTVFTYACGENPSQEPENPGDFIKLASPKKKGAVSVEEAISNRRSVRAYSDKILTFQDVSQILWSAQGITSPHGLRAAPSAGATYPMEIYLVASSVEGISPGAYRYIPAENSLQVISRGDINRELSEAALGQDSVRRAAANLVIAADYGRTTRKYGDRGIRYVHIEVGHIAQNVYLQAEALRLGTVIIGAFYDDRVKGLLKIDEDPLAIMPLGKL